MKVKLILLLCLCATVFADDEEHTTLDDYHDFDLVVKNMPVLKSHLNCYIDEGPCNELQESYKKNMIAAVKETCARCNNGQKHMFHVFLDGLKTADREGYDKYRQRYDPDGTKFDALEEELWKY